MSDVSQHDPAHFQGVPSAPPTTARYAEWQHRVFATLIDSALILTVSVVGSVLGQLSFLLSVLFGMAGLALALYFGYLNGCRGQSPGKALLGLAVVREDGQLLGGGMGVARSLALMVAGALTFGLGAIVAVLWPLWDEPKRQALHDKVFGTVVLSGQRRIPLGGDLFRP